MLSVLNKHAKRRLNHHLNCAIAGLRSFTLHNESANQVHLSSRNVIFSGIQPTGVPHLGNYLGALQQWVKIQNEASTGSELLFSIADLHAITIHQNAEELRKWKRETLAILLAVGLDPERSTIFYQSDVPAHAELMWILSCTASVGYLSRMTQWKSKLALPAESAIEGMNARARLKLGLFSYPVLQAADILVYGATHVPVGEDQVQHLEFARKCANGFNSVYGQTVLREPVTMLSPAKRVMSLTEPTLKMSKSHADARSRVLLNDNPAIIDDKIRLALTDSTAGVSYDPIKRPGVSNLLTIMSYLNPGRGSFEEVAEQFSNQSMREFKKEVATVISGGLADVRVRYNNLISDTLSLEEIAAKGAASARRKATHTMKLVRKVVGL